MPQSPEKDPQFSLVLPMTRADLYALQWTLDSVQRQADPDWELLLCAEPQHEAALQRFIAEHYQREARIKRLFSPGPATRPQLLNHSMKSARGEFIAVIEPGDTLHRVALDSVAELLDAAPDADLIYSDEDRRSASGKRSRPFFKPDWSPESALSFDYVGELCVYRKSLVERLGGFRDGLQDQECFDLVLRISEASKKILHIPRVLYHRRQDGSAEAAGSNTAGLKRVIADHLARQGKKAKMEDGLHPGRVRARFEIQGAETVSIIIPTRDKFEVLRTCLDSIRAKTTYSNHEIIIVDNNTSDALSLDYLSKLPYKVVVDRERFNFSRLCNRGAQAATGQHLLFLNNDTEVITPEWLEAMLEYSQQPEIGAVGAKLLYPGGGIQHAGVVTGMGLGAVAGHVLGGEPADSNIHFGYAGMVRNCSAVTGACMMMRRDVFERMDGFDEGLAVAFNDIDLCLRILAAGYRIVWTPYAMLYHHESLTRGRIQDPDEARFMHERWGKRLSLDPYYNPNLTLKATHYGLAWPPRV